MSSTTRIIVILSAAAVIIVMAILALAWSRGRRAQTAQGAQNGQEVQIEQPIISHAEQGTKAWQLQLRQVKIASGGQTVNAYGVREGLIYGSGGKPVVRITADRIAGDTATRDFSVLGNVNVVNSDGTIFAANRVNWVQGQQKLDCPGAVTMRNTKVTISTTGLGYFINQNLVTCPNQIKMTNGDNWLMGRNLRYDVKTANFQMQGIQGIFNAQEIRTQLRGVAP